LLDVAKVGGHVAGEEDVGEEQHLLVRKFVGHFERSHMGIGDAEKFRLPAGVAAEEVRIAEQAARRVPPQLLRILLVGIGSLAGREFTA
jgi:hypothetical protein